MRLQIERVGRCVERFKGDIEIWDVVNEATHYDREELKRNCAEADRGHRQDGHRRIRPQAPSRRPARRTRRRR